MVPQPPWREKKRLWHRGQRKKLLQMPPIVTAITAAKPNDAITPKAIDAIVRDKVPIAILSGRANAQSAKVA